MVCGICLFELLYSDMKHIIIRRPGPYGHHLVPSSIVVVCLFKHFYTEMLLDRLMLCNIIRSLCTGCHSCAFILCLVQGEGYIVCCWYCSLVVLADIKTGDGLVQTVACSCHLHIPPVVCISFCGASLWICRLLLTLFCMAI